MTLIDALQALAYCIAAYTVGVGVGKLIDAVRWMVGDE